ncbi:hypothetical protein OCU04_012910 [Sclerotinia nivalis]|uniref:Uncharacterized protein n=1 Tax=Sclerotinia nivalis TaxID=352851 RepID=A0A9X0A8A3_9HELO|nr:hypothetical protein OCU04_012910 [Sclerotinia nivalis]
MAFGFTLVGNTIPTSIEGIRIEIQRVFGQWSIIIQILAELNALVMPNLVSDCEIVNAMKQKVTALFRTLVIGDSNFCAADDVDGWQKKFSIWNQNLCNAEYYNKNSSKVFVADNDLMNFDIMKQKG